MPWLLEPSFEALLSLTIELSTTDAQSPLPFLNTALEGKDRKSPALASSKSGFHSFRNQKNSPPAFFSNIFKFM